MISVVIPVYNRFPLLCEAVESVMSQTYTDFELIVVDDGSTDGAERIISLYPQVQYHRISHTGMPGLVRNHGVSLAAGDLVAFLDSDDLWEPQKLARQMERFETDDALVLSHTREIWLRGGRVISQKRFRHRREGDVFTDALHKCMIGPSTVMMRRSVFESFGGFREDLEIAEDYEFWLRITACHQVSYIDEPLTTKRAGHGAQLSEKYGQIEIFRIRGLKGLVDSRWFVHNASEQHQLKAAEKLAEKCAIYAQGAAKRGRQEEAALYEQLSQQYTAASLHDGSRPL